MEQTTKYKRFAKKKDTQLMTNNAVIYTRVSSKEQADGNASLDTQLKYCNEYAKKKGFNVVEYFGGTYESAKSDERKEFNKMLSFLKRRKNISYVIVYSYDRFSRTGANAAYISLNLKKRGIHTISVSQEVDTSKPSGVFQENLYYMFSQFDNELRKDKAVTGMKEKLRNGYWCFHPPVGYENLNRGETADKAEYVLNKKGKMIKKAFEWVHKYGWNMEKVSAELAKRGTYITAKRLTVILRNPFYAGLITSSIIPNEIYEGKQEKAISYKKFIEVNDIMDGKSISRKHVNHKKKNEDIPLRGHLYCDECSNKMTAYKASKNQKYYYKCTTKGCGNNQRAEQIHEIFREILKYYQIPKKDFAPLVDYLKAEFKDLISDTNEKKKELNKNLSGLNSKLEKLEEKYLFEGVSQEMYQKHLAKITKEKNEILKDLDAPQIKFSNLENFINMAVEISCNMLKIWDLSDYDEKMNLLKLLFPDGILYNRKKLLFRTLSVNKLFESSPLFSETYKAQKEKGELFLNNSPQQVGVARFELTIPCSQSRCLNRTGPHPELISQLRVQR